MDPPADAISIESDTEETEERTTIPMMMHAEETMAQGFEGSMIAQGPGTSGSIVRQPQQNGSILKVKNKVQAEPSQLSLLAIEEARRYQQVEKGYKERKAKLRAAEGWHDNSMQSAATAATGVTHKMSTITTTTTSATQAPPVSSDFGEWEFSAPPKTDGCCVIS